MSRLMHVLSEKRSDMVCLGQGLLLWGWVMCLESQKTNVFFFVFFCVFLCLAFGTQEKNADVYLNIRQKTRMCFSN